jgi:hypothetical protein
LIGPQQRIFRPLNVHEHQRAGMACKISVQAGYGAFTPDFDLVLQAIQLAVFPDEVAACGIYFVCNDFRGWTALCEAQRVISPTRTDINNDFRWAADNLLD